jgi:uncharacterized membrane protein YgaE (UPF0421/DUF939 family)
MEMGFIIEVLLTIIGVLVTCLVGFFVKSIQRDIEDLRDMFHRHVRDKDIHNYGERYNH